MKHVAKRPKPKQHQSRVNSNPRVGTKEADATLVAAIPTWSVTKPRMAVQSFRYCPAMNAHQAPCRYKYPELTWIPKDLGVRHVRPGLVAASHLAARGFQGLGFAASSTPIHTRVPHNTKKARPRARGARRFLSHLHAARNSRRSGSSLTVAQLQNIGFD